MENTSRPPTGGHRDESPAARRTGLPAEPAVRAEQAGPLSGAPTDRPERRHRAGARRHRAGIVPPEALGLTGTAAPGRPPGFRRASMSPGLLDPAVADLTDDEELAGTRDEAEENRRRALRRHRLTLAGLALTATVAAVLLVVTLTNWAPASARELTATERERLAVMRVTNYRELRAGLHVTVGDGSTRTDLLGWVDWARQLAYLDVTGPGAGPLRGLTQATPTVLVLRPDPTAVPAPAMPPLVPPTDGWRLPADRRLDPVLSFIFTLANDRPDPADGFSGHWAGQERINGETVDVLSARPPHGDDGARRYWLDPAGRLHRLEASLPDVGPVHVQLNRADRPTLRPVDALGGRVGLPRALTAAERERWRRLPARLRAAGGAAVTVTAPTAARANLRGAGWLSWTSGTAYLGVTDLDAEGRRTLLRQDAQGVTRIEGAIAGGHADPPPLPPPVTGWRAGAHRTDALTPLLDAALGAARDSRPAGSVRDSGPAGSVRRIRGDKLAGSVVDVLEVDTGRSRARYWLARNGLLRRLELPTREGTWAQLDLTPGRVPPLAAPTRPR
ncbi:hypothetical protein [Micromonospora endophytica]|uniref:Uncharacterized protein n=1 Tax=Micromonospora endophytica TaxID=515350 RepID=A0A2W2DDH4_9ACTN|nr:hypothetical protein [Micromonospora endophytica]PZF97867.1 hypothetical protein C1I93_10455 [Micromonospora endophytica]RIW41032.1 hypothetical protein D3H59_27440 [Micromonospora endophytica]BCJ61278.1 hypothetical protein Jiend_47000 [Micromonospora endophytica]